MNLKVNEIFYSIQGESTRTGFPCLFLRLTGCNLNCRYCDTKYARDSGTIISIDDILKKVKVYGTIDHITITGGEPLIQSNSIDLMKKLLDLQYAVQLETNGSILFKDVPKDVRKISDIKTPSSGEPDSFNFHNLNYLDAKDEVKFVISDNDDYEYAKKIITEHLRDIDAVINFSPVTEKFSASKLAELILIDRLQVRLNLQLHKIIWPDGEPKNMRVYE